MIHLYVAYFMVCMSYFHLDFLIQKFVYTWQSVHSACLSVAIVTFNLYLVDASSMGTLLRKSQSSCF